MLIKAKESILIKAVLSSLPLYYLSLFKMPAKVAHEINKLQRRFLWSGKSQGKYNALVKWDTLQRPKEKGGLGLADCMMKNAALLFKWWWRYALEEGSYWKRVIDSIHEDGLTLLPSKSCRTIQGLWTEIWKMAHSDSPVKCCIIVQMVVEVCLRRRIILEKGY